MAPQWVANWQRDRTRQLEKLEAERKRRENEKALLESSIIWWWGTDNSLPSRIVVQGIKTYPTMRLTDLPHILDMLAVTATDPIQVYDLTSRYWQFQTASDSFNIKHSQVLLLRRTGVTSCLDIDKCIWDAERSDNALPRGSVHNTPLPTLVGDIWEQPRGTKRYRNSGDDDELSSRAYRIPRRTLSQATPHPSRPTAVASPLMSLSPGLYTSASGSAPSSSPLPSSDSEAELPDVVTVTLPGRQHGRLLDGDFGLGLTLPLQSATPPLLRTAQRLPPSPQAPACEPSSEQEQDLPSSSGTYDDLWASGRVHVPDSAAALTWPYGLYACDVARGLSLIAELQAEIGADGVLFKKRKLEMLPEHFQTVFPGCKFVLKTYYTQRSVWKNASETERLAMLQQPRTQPEGLWTTFRATLTSWAALKGHRRKPGRQ
ncbi:hypothetical protein FKP32DRAFT_1675130 [Trametes sanguinea]|nr:hypothetical protein FKP32DRAFT_1675130 [Trametes sanguinea]